MIEPLTAWILKGLIVAFEIAEAEFLRHVDQSAAHLMWLLGAGASRSSGLPTATDIIWDLKLKIYCAQQNQDIRTHDVSNKAVQSRIQSYMESMGFPPLWDAREYSFYFEHFFGEDYSSQQKYLKEALSTEKITSTVGQRALSMLLHMGRSRLIFTTNFDEVVETSYAAVTGRNLSTFHLEGAYAATDSLNSDQFPFYTKLHGDFRYQSIKNLPKDLLHNDQQLQKCFLAAAARFGLIVAGYSGRDENVMSMIRQAIDQNNAFPHGLFWTVPRISIIAPNVNEVIDLAKSKGITSGVVQTGAFDEMLLKIWRNTAARTKELDDKVRSSAVRPVSIPLPPPGNQPPILRTNALRIIHLPESCGVVEYVGDINITDIRSKLFEVQPDCTLTYTDRIIFWGDRLQIEKIMDKERIRTTTRHVLDNLTGSVNESGIIKAFVEEALGKALTAGKPLNLRKSGRTWYVVVKHDRATSDTLMPLRRALGSSGNPGRINGNVPGQCDVYWSEAISIRIEERDDALWLLLRPDIWISPLTERPRAIDFLRKRKLKRYNNQSFEVLSAWVSILLGAIGRPQVAEVAAHAGSEHSAIFGISTRTAYSRGSSANGQ
jgi:hypothetical protein